ncbi:putative NRAMP family protein [Helianthus debilis subsp. tardiflorus]
MVINGYLLLDFFVAEVNGFLFGSLAVTCTAAYVAFIIYLINHGNCLPSTLFNRIVNKGYAYIGK